MLPPTLLNLGFCDPSRREALGTRSPPRKHQPSFNQLPVLQWHTKVAMPGCITKTKRAEDTGRQYGHRT